MSLDKKTTVVAKISAAVACNALASLRVAITEALEMGLSLTEIQEVLALATEIQKQPVNHVSHLVEQLLREPKKAAHEHSSHCGCDACHS